MTGKRGQKRTSRDRRRARDATADLLGFYLRLMTLPETAALGVSHERVKAGLIEADRNAMAVVLAASFHPSRDMP